MPQKTNLKAAPYFDDYDSRKDFYKVLYRPGYPVQGRELNTTQSILQNQIESYGKYAFKQGDLVVPGEVGLNKKLDFVKLSSVSEVAVNVDGELVYKKYDIDGLVGQKVNGLSSGVIAIVQTVVKTTENNSDTLYVKYLTAGDSGDEERFRQGETLEVVDGINSPLLVVGTDGSVLPTSVAVLNPDRNETTFVESGAMGFASAVQVEEGVYFVNGYFVRNDAGLIVVDGYSDNPSVKVGFKITETLVTPEDEPSLYDNAFGSSNYAAPGAHRLQIILNLVKYQFEETSDKNFIQLLSIKNGVIQKQVKKAAYNTLENTLARRTYDESGDYVVENFDVDIREFYQRDGNFGLYSAGVDGTVGPNRLSASDAANKLITTVGAGKAYVRGFEIINKETKYLEIDKARETISRDNVTIKSNGLSSFALTNVYNTLPLNAEGADLTAYPTVFLNAVCNDGNIGFNNLEGSTEYRQTISRRGLGFTKDDAIKTIWLFASADLGLIDETSISDSPGSGKLDLRTLYFVQTRSSTNGVATTNTVKVLSYAKVTRPEIGDTNAQYLQLTVLGRKDLLDNVFLEYDDDVQIKRRVLYTSLSDVQQEVNNVGYIVDYTESIVPVVGIAKPKDVSLLERPEGFNQDTDIIISRGKLADGRETYSGKFGVSYFNPVFFTRLLVDAPVTPDFAPGKYIIGTQSGAYGVVEGASNGYMSLGRSLYVKSLYGNFIPGETITSEEGSTLRIPKNNTVSHFVVKRQGTGYVAGSKININGTLFESADVEVGIDGGTVYKVTITNRNSLQTIFAKPPICEVTGSSTIAAGVYPVLFRDTVLTYNAQNVKSLYSVFGSNNKFSADVDTGSDILGDTKTVTQSTFSGTKGYTFIESDSFSSDASLILQQGDLVQFTDDTARLNKFVVSQVTKPRGTDKSRIYLNGALPDTVVGKTVIRQRGKVSNGSSSTLLFPTGSKEVGSLVKSTEDTKITYYIRRDFVTTGSDNGGNITFAAQLDFGTQRFTEFTEKDFLITVLDKGGSDLVETGDVVYVSSNFVTILNTTDATSGLSSGSITLTFPGNYFGNNVTNFPKLKLTATIEVSKGRPKLKTAIKNKRVIIQSPGDLVLPIRGLDYDSDSTEVFSYSDAFRIRYIYEGSSSAPPTVDVNGNLVVGTDLTNRFTFDDGQRDTFYDVSRIVLKPGFSAPTGQIVVAFDYFEHSQGDFCTVDSYIHEAGVVLDEIPDFNSNVHGNLSLKNVVDFRPKVDSTAIVPGYQDTSLLSQSEYINFIGPGGSVSSTPASARNLPYTISFSESQYLDRIDGVFLNKKGEFIVKKGNASLNPSKPEIIEDGIPLYYLFIPAFTKTSKDVRITPVDNRRYTMRDIGKLEKRVERLEYYTTLSILEQQTLNMQVKDSLGIDKTKSGFLVDNFETHNVGNVKSIDHLCSIDSQQSVLRPQSKEDSFQLVEVNTRDDQRVISGYTNSNGVITLPFTSVEYASNVYATKEVNPNPFVVLQYVGDAALMPNIDQWYNSFIAPLVTENNTNLFSVFLAKQDAKVAFSSIYNSFVINWVGINKTFYNLKSFAENNGRSAESTVANASTGTSSNISPQNNEIAKGVGYKTVNGTNVSNALKFYARSIAVKYVVKRMKPKTKLHVFMEGRNIARWVNPDSRFTGISGNSPTTFGTSITTDEYGNASGIILVPSGFAPKENSFWTGNIDTMQYDDTSEEVYFTTGIKTIRFTSSMSDAPITDVDGVSSFAEVKFYATGILPENPSSIISTTPAIFKANEGVQEIDSNTQNKERPNPMAQTFRVESFEGGMFTTGVDLFFSEKSDTVPLRVYLSNVESDKPGKYIVPGSVKTLYPDTFLKVYSSGNITIQQGEEITGNRSLAKGPISKVLDRNNFEVTPSSNGEISITNEQTYTFILSNHNGKDFLTNEDLTLATVTSYNNANNATVGLKIAKDSGRVSKLNITNIGSGYESATITIESPQLPGGSNATGSVKVSGGQMFFAETSLAGRGYTEAPSVVIRGTGAGNNGAVIESVIEIDEPAVRMGIAIDVSGGIQSTTPTRFNFEYPVYLQNDTEYAINIECDTVEYKLWSSKLGEDDISSGLVVNTQPLLGSLFKSQNTANWEEDLFEDIKFTLYRAEFNTDIDGDLTIKNQDLGYEKLNTNPFETYALANSTATSPLFKNNSNIVKVYHRDNGFEDTGDSKVFFRGLPDFAGFDAIDIESTLFQVSNVGVDSYNIVGPARASDTGFFGEEAVLASYNRKYEKLYAQIPYLQVSGTSINSMVKTTDVVPVDSNTKNYTSYSTTEYETTFLNEEQYFLNQKFIASKINESLNNIEGSLMYKLTLKSDTSHLSPVIDLRSASVKTISNRVEVSNGQESRYGKQYQKLQLFPVYKFTVQGNESGGSIVPISIAQNVTGVTSGAESEVLRVVDNNVFVKIKNSVNFTLGETLYFSTQSVSGGDLDGIAVTITNDGIFNEVPDFVVGSTVTAFNPSARTEKYSNKVSGKVIFWDTNTQMLTLENDKRPIDNDYTSQITLGSSFARTATTSLQTSDIFRVGDIIDFQSASFETSKFAEIKSMNFGDGVDFVSENGSVNTSGVAKYVTKEISLASSSSSLSTKLTVNATDVNNIQVLYKTKPEASQQKFDDISWTYFNEDGSPDNDVIATAQNSISGQYESQDAYQELSFSVSDIPDFSSFAIKIVMKSDNPSYVPKIQDMRTVASF
jgi:hypothetical protein